jgi:hypothetical protein
MEISESLVICWYINPPQITLVTVHFPVLKEFILLSTTQKESKMSPTALVQAIVT